VEEMAWSPPPLVCTCSLKPHWRKPSKPLCVGTEWGSQERKSLRLGDRALILLYSFDSCLGSNIVLHVYVESLLDLSF
jgi:hypothetical protein